MNTNTANNIEAADDKIIYDNNCKDVLSDKNLLAVILKYCVPEYKNCSLSDICNIYIENEPIVSSEGVHKNTTNIKGITTEDNSINEGVIRFDILFEAKLPNSNERIGLLINVEIQNKYNPGYPLMKRAIYYAARMISSQKDRYFTNSHYEDLKKVYSIWICTNPDKEHTNIINQYNLTETNVIGNVKEKVPNYDLMSVIMICLGRGNDKKKDILNFLELLLLPKSVEHTKTQIESMYNIQMTEKATKGVESMCNVSDGIEERGIDIGVFNSLRNLITTTGWDVTKALKMLIVPEDKHEMYTQKLREEGIVN